MKLLVVTWLLTLVALSACAKSPEKLLQILAAQQSRSHFNSNNLVPSSIENHSSAVQLVKRSTDQLTNDTNMNKSSSDIPQVSNASTTTPISVQRAEQELANSFNNGTEYVEPPYMQHMTTILVTLHVSVFISGLIGNSLVCLSVIRNKSLQTVTNYYIVNLAVADFLVILICLPPTVYWDLTLTWNFGLVLCKLVLYLQSISVSVSVLTLTCISIDRWYAICRPLEFSSTKYRAKITIGLIWLVSMLIASPDVIFLTTKHLYEENDLVYTDCTYSWPDENTKIYQLCLVTLLFIGPFVLMSISYSHIVNVLWRNETIAESLQESHQLEEQQQAYQQMKLRQQLELEASKAKQQVGQVEVDVEVEVDADAEQRQVPEASHSENLATGEKKSRFKLVSQFSLDAFKCKKNKLLRSTTATTTTTTTTTTNSKHFEASKTDTVVCEKASRSSVRRLKPANAPIERHDNYKANSSGSINESSAEQRLNKLIALEKDGSNKIDNRAANCYHEHSISCEQTDDWAAGRQVGCDAEEQGQKLEQGRNFSPINGATTKSIVCRCRRPRRCCCCCCASCKRKGNKHNYDHNDDGQANDQLSLNAAASGESRAMQIPRKLTHCATICNFIAEAKDESHLSVSIDGRPASNSPLRPTQGVGLTRDEHDCVDADDYECRCERRHNNQTKVLLKPQEDTGTGHNCGRPSSSLGHQRAGRCLGRRRSRPAPLSLLPRRCLSLGQASQLEATSGIQIGGSSNNNEAALCHGHAKWRNGRQHSQLGPNSSRRRDSIERRNEISTVTLIDGRRQKSRLSQDSRLREGDQNGNPTTTKTTQDASLMSSWSSPSPTRKCRFDSSDKLASASHKIGHQLSRDEEEEEEEEVGDELTKLTVRQKPAANKLTSTIASRGNFLPAPSYEEQTLSCGSSSGGGGGGAASDRRAANGCCLATSRRRHRLSILWCPLNLNILIDGRHQRQAQQQQQQPKPKPKPISEGARKKDGAGNNLTTDRANRKPASVARNKTTTTTTTAHMPNNKRHPPATNGISHCSSSRAATTSSTSVCLSPNGLLAGETSCNSNSPDASKGSRVALSDDATCGPINFKAALASGNENNNNNNGPMRISSELLVTATGANEKQVAPSDCSASIARGSAFGTLTSRLAAMSSPSSPLRKKLRQLPLGKPRFFSNLADIRCSQVNAAKVTSSTTTGDYNNNNNNNNNSPITTRINSMGASNASCRTTMSQSRRYVPTHARFCKLIESRKKAAKMLIVIVIMFGLCYLPIHFLNLLRYTIGLPQNDITTIASLVSHWLCYFNSAVNPLIYNLMSGKFRHEFANLFFCRCFRRSNH